MTTPPEADFLSRSHAILRAYLASRGDATLPSPGALEAAYAALPRPTDADYLSPRGAEAAHQHILSALVPALTGQNLSGRYFGFVTGSALPVAEAADNIVSALDQNVQVHLPGQSVATAVEDAALVMLLALLDLGPARAWAARTFTTGATASNVLGLAAGREAVVGAPAAAAPDRPAVAELGLLEACRRAGVRRVQVLTSMAHSSLFKAASIVGLGRAAVKELPLSEDEPWRLDIDAVERELAASADGVVSIIVVSGGEVNTGGFATACRAEMERLRALADLHGAHIHVDGGTIALAHIVEKMHDESDIFGVPQLSVSLREPSPRLLNLPISMTVLMGSSWPTALPLTGTSFSTW